MTDDTTLRSVHTDLAVNAFREAEQKKYQLELKDYALQRALANDIDAGRYYAETEEVRARYERDRVLAAGRGALPKG